ncbi:cyclic-di-AMP receptor [Proteiniborus sp. MB09-C3]|uniref:cyclic-di-AMP receptor n=1 Tax=Proteiniborus sp. MB09-C3 TaxID=3050072 RepID=UPI002556D61C|nr:cyclic-di-AMP receptor [Proteiniborus sp. MB09-C3]WIV12319.1 cyclic-di-AMP receptor [Proteiniborus sp. MB09-C3]
MKLVIAITQDEDTANLVSKLTEEGFRVTKLASTGGFLKSGNTTLLIGVDDDKVEDLVKVIEKVCRPREVTTPATPMSLVEDVYMPYTYNIKVGGATIFILDVDRYERI